MKLVNLIALATILGACGAPDANDKFSARAKPHKSGFADEADATAAAAAPGPAVAAPAPVAAPQEELCLGIALHGEHEQCDEDDDAIGDIVAQEPVAAPVAEAPAMAVPAPVAPAPVAAAPAPAPAPAPQAPAPAPVPVGDPNIVEFRIKAGTGTAGWNDAASLVNVKVGQTLRIFNDDAVNHRLHTNGAPCPHGVNFAPGKSFDCKATKAYDRAEDGDVYDHIAGNAAVFFLKVTP